MLKNNEEKVYVYIFEHMCKIIILIILQLFQDKHIDNNSVLITHIKQSLL